MAGQENKKAPERRLSLQGLWFSTEEGLVRVELTMADLQSAALATWLQPLDLELCLAVHDNLQPRKPVTIGQVVTPRPVVGKTLLALYRLVGV